MRFSWCAVLAIAAVTVASGCGPAPQPAHPVPVPSTKEGPQPADATPKPEPPPPWEDEANRIQAPPIQPAVALPLPDMVRGKLRNGMTMTLIPDHSLPLVTVMLKLRAGSVDDPAPLVGLADFVAAMLRHGTRTRTADAISELVDSAGISLGASAGYEQTTISCFGRSGALSLCLELVSELARFATFPEDEMAQVRRQLLGGIKQQRDDPGTLAQLHFHNRLYGDDHPAGRPMTAATVRAITRDSLVRFVKQRFRPNAATLGIAGAFDEKAVQAELKRWFGRWKRGRLPRRKVKPVGHPAAGTPVLVVDKPDLNQAFFTLGHAGIPRTHADRYPVLVLNHVLGGGGFSSRLMRVVRSEQGKTYGISSRFSMETADGSFSVSSFTKTGQFVDTLKVVLSELRRMRKDPPNEAERRAAQGKLAGSYPIRFQTSERLLSALLRIDLFKLGTFFITQYPVEVERVTLDQLATAATRHLLPDRLAVVVVGKASELVPQLRQAGIAFEQVNYLEPISRRQRQIRAGKVRPTIPAARQRAARKLLGQVLVKAGGRKALARVRSLRMTGGARMGKMAGAFSSTILLPDRWRQQITFGPVVMTQVLHGDRGFARVERDGQKQQKPLPAAKLATLRRQLWQHPVLVPLRVADKTLPARILEKGTTKKRVNIQVYPKGQPPLTVTVAVDTGHVVGLRQLDESGNEEVIELSDHKKVDGVLVPMTVKSRIEGRPPAEVRYKAVVINPKVTAKQIDQ